MTRLLPRARVRARAAIVVLAFLAAQAAPVAGPDLRVAVTRHTGEFNGQAVAYTATVGEMLIPGPDGQPAASMVTTSYVRDDVKDASRRPVMFVFNGGPGASSSPLHTRALGVRYVAPDKDGMAQLVPNPYSPLDVTDLVFIDPIGTGFSRPLPGTDGRIFWSVKSDAESVKFFIESWLKANQREASPVFVCGESYGTTRAAELAYIGKDLRFAGVILVSLTGGVSGNELPFVTTFPTFAVTAAYHGKVDAAGRSVSDIFDEAARFARTEYIGALIEGTSISAAEQHRIAGEMSRRIGLPAAFIEEKDLRLSREDFMMNLLKDRGERTGQLDGRSTGRFEEYADKRPPYNDPGLGAGSNAPRPRPGVNLVQEYLVKELKFPATDEYNSLNLDVNAKWKYDVVEAHNPAARMAAAMHDQPQLRLFWTGGYYDITTPLAAAQYAVYNSGVPADRTTMGAFIAGHEVYGGGNVGAFTAAIRTFILGKR